MIRANRFARIACATKYSAEKAQIPKSAGESAGKSAGNLLEEQCWEAAVLGRAEKTALPGSPHSSALFPGTLPRTLPGAFGDSPVAGGRK